MTAPIGNGLRAVPHVGLLALLCLLAALPAGCERQPGYPMATATGTVTIGGKPVPRGYITFSPTGNGAGPVVGAPIENGRYRCTQVPRGPLHATFIAQAAEMGTIYDQVNKTTHQVPKDILPARYRTGINVEIKTAEPSLDFRLEGK
jgi:hypothetical protein